MLCPECNKREAETHLTQIVNNKKVTVSLCKECAAKLGFHSPLDNMPFPLAELLSGMTSGFPKGEEGAGGEKLECSSCGLDFDQFAQQGRFGCGECYASFRPRLEGIMRKIHGSSIHRGRNPGMSADIDSNQVAPVQEEARVEEELRKAIETEDFERAAELRDKLRALREGFAIDK